MKNSIRYSNEEIILSPNSKSFYFLKWLKGFGPLDSFTLMRAEELVEILGSDFVPAHHSDKKIISFADIPVGPNILDSDFLHLSQEYRHDIQLRNISDNYYEKNMPYKRGGWDYDMNLFHVAKIIEDEISQPDRGLLQTYNNFYLRADNGGIVRVCIYCHPKKKLSFSNYGIEICVVNKLDSEEISGRIFIGCGSVKE